MVQFGMQRGASLSRKVDLSGRKQANRKFLEEHAFLNNPAAPFLDTQLLDDLVTGFYTYLEPTPRLMAGEEHRHDLIAQRCAVQGLSALRVAGAKQLTEQVVVQRFRGLTCRDDCIDGRIERAERMPEVPVSCKQAGQRPEARRQAFLNLVHRWAEVVVAAGLAEHRANDNGQSQA